MFLSIGQTPYLFLQILFTVAQQLEEFRPGVLLQIHLIPKEHWKRKENM